MVFSVPFFRVLVDLGSLDSFDFDLGGSVKLWVSKSSCSSCLLNISGLFLLDLGWLVESFLEGISLSDLSCLLLLLVEKEFLVHRLLVNISLTSLSIPE